MIFIDERRDVQSQPMVGSFKLTRVGVTGVKKPVRVKRTGHTVTLTAEMDVFVDLPSTQKGSHMSRHVEVISEILDLCVREPVKGLEELCASICESMLGRHEYASYSEVHARADYFLERKTKSGKRSLEKYGIIAKSVARKDGSPVKKLIGVEVVGMTACPCAMETTRELLTSRFPEHAECLKNIPVITHNQRNVSTVMIEVPEQYDIEADDLIDIVEGSLSSPTFEILKRDDEAEVVIDAHFNPKFVEDVVRDILGKIIEKYPELPDDVSVTVRSESEESIHKHNAFAERVTTMAELRA